VARRQFDGAIQEAGRRRERIGTRHAPEQHESRFIVREKREIELEVLAGPGPVGVYDSQAGAVEDERPPLVGAHRVKNRIAPDFVETIVPAGDEGRDEWNATAARFEASAAFLVRATNDREPQYLQQGYRNTVGNRPDARRGPARCFTPSGPFVKCANGIGRRDEASGDAGKFGYCE
jgi:hypothetical protein